jgi:hypothetical protein
MKEGAANDDEPDEGGAVGTATRVGGYLAALALVLGVGWGLGVLAGPVAPAAAIPATPSAMAPATGMAGTDMSGRHPGDDTRTEIGTSGLAASAQGRTLVPLAATLAPAVPVDLAFAVVDGAGARVTAFPAAPAVTVVRRDGAGFQTLTPTAAPDGTWHAPLRLPAPGVYRMIADLGGTVLGTDLFAPGDFAPQPQGPTRVAEVDGFQVRLDGDLVPGEPSQIFATVSRDGVPVADLQPYAGAFGRLVTLREGDLAYRVAGPGDGRAPAPAPGDRSGPAVAFTTIVPSAGTYRLYLQFQEGGTVHTATFGVVTRVVR